MAPVPVLPRTTARVVMIPAEVSLGMPPEEARHLAQEIVAEGERLIALGEALIVWLQQDVNPWVVGPDPTDVFRFVSELERDSCGKLEYPYLWYELTQCPPALDVFSALLSHYRDRWNAPVPDIDLGGSAFRRYSDDAGVLRALHRLRTSTSRGRVLIRFENPPAASWISCLRAAVCAWWALYKLSLGQVDEAVRLNDWHLTALSMAAGINDQALAGEIARLGTAATHLIVREPSRDRSLRNAAGLYGVPLHFAEPVSSPRSDPGSVFLAEGCPSPHGPRGAELLLLEMISRLAQTGGVYVPSWESSCRGIKVSKFIDEVVQRASKLDELDGNARIRLLALTTAQWLEQDDSLLV